MITKNNIKLIIKVTLSALLAYILLSPFLTVLLFANSLQSRDPRRVEKFIDFPLLSQSVQIQVKTILNARIMSTDQNNLFNTLLLLSIDPIVESIARSVISPDGLYYLFKLGELPQPVVIPIDEEQSMISSPNKTNKNHEKAFVFKFKFQSLNKFEIKSVFDKPNSDISALWHRQGLFNWRIVNISIPEKLLGLR